MDNVNRYPQEVLDLLTPEGFNNYFEKEAKNHRLHEDAYNAVEEVYKKYFGQRKYANFVSFKRVREHVRKKSRVKHG